MNQAEWEEKNYGLLLRKLSIPAEGGESLWIEFF